MNCQHVSFRLGFRGEVNESGKSDQFSSYRRYEIEIVRCGISHRVEAKPKRIVRSTCQYNRRSTGEKLRRCQKRDTICSLAGSTEITLQLWCLHQYGHCGQSGSLQLSDRLTPGVPRMPQTIRRLSKSKFRYVDVGGA